MEIRQSFFETEYELQQLVDLQNITYKDRGLHFSTDSFRFWYKSNPCGNVISVNAFDGDKMVAHYACIPIEMRIAGRIAKGIHSMATVTHPDYRGRGLFRTLAQKTYEIAQQEEYEFVSGVANANSYPGFIKHLGFYLIDRLDVKWGWGKVINTSENKLCYGNWDLARLNWRLKKYSYYSKHGNYAYGMYHVRIGIKTLLCTFEKETIDEIVLKRSLNILRPFNLYIGLGADLSKGHYFNFPKFVKHSPFNLIFKDLTGGKLPPIGRDNIFFQLIDFDVA